MQGWYWYITTMTDMLLLGEKVTSGITTSATLEIMKRLHKNEGRLNDNKYNIKGHFNNQLSYLLEGKLQSEMKEGDMITLERVASMATDITFNTKLKVFLKEGHIYVGPNLMGFCFDIGQRIIEEREVNVFAFPVDDKPEIITIGKWPDGKHFYIKSSKQRVFTQNKYNTFEEAEREALLYADKEHIKDSPVMPFVYSRYGD
jgi:hypothetical protein